MRELFPVQMPLTDDLKICTPDVIGIDIPNSCLFEGYATTWDVDSTKKQMIPGAVKNYSCRPLLLEHDIGVCIGVITEIKEDHIGLKVIGYLDTTIPGVDQIINLFKTGHCLNLSIGGFIDKFSIHDSASPLLIEDYTLIEVSIVSQPINRLAIITHIR